MWVLYQLDGRAHIAALTHATHTGTSVELTLSSGETMTYAAPNSDSADAAWQVLREHLEGGVPLLDTSPRSQPTQTAAPKPEPAPEAPEEIPDAVLLEVFQAARARGVETAALQQVLADAGATRVTGIAPERRAEAVRHVQGL